MPPRAFRSGRSSRSTSSGEILGCLLSLKSPTPVDGNWTGVFGQKNHLAVHMFILYTTAFVIMLDKGSNKFLRLFAATFRAGDGPS